MLDQVLVLDLGPRFLPLSDRTRIRCLAPAYTRDHMSRALSDKWVISSSPKIKHSSLRRLDTFKRVRLFGNNLSLCQKRCSVQHAGKSKGLPTTMRPNAARKPIVDVRQHCLSCAGPQFLGWLPSKLLCCSRSILQKSSNDAQL